MVQFCWQSDLSAYYQYSRRFEQHCVHCFPGTVCPSSCGQVQRVSRFYGWRGAVPQPPARRLRTSLRKGRPTADLAARPQALLVSYVVLVSLFLANSVCGLLEASAALPRRKLQPVLDGDREVCAATAGRTGTVRPTEAHCGGAAGVVRPVFAGRGNPDAAVRAMTAGASHAMRMLAGK